MSGQVSTTVGDHVGIPGVVLLFILFDHIALLARQGMAVGRVTKGALYLYIWFYVTLMLVWSWWLTYHTTINQWDWRETDGKGLAAFDMTNYVITFEITGHVIAFETTCYVKAFLATLSLLKKRVTLSLLKRRVTLRHFWQLYLFWKNGSRYRFWNDVLR